MFLLYKLFLKNSIFQENCEKTVLVTHLTIFLGKGFVLSPKININFLTSNQISIPKRQKCFGNLQFLIKHVNWGHFQDCFIAFMKIFHRILTNDGMIVFLQSLMSFTLHHTFSLACLCSLLQWCVLKCSISVR